MCVVTSVRQPYSCCDRIRGETSRERGRWLLSVGRQLSNTSDVTCTARSVNGLLPNRNVSCSAARAPFRYCAPRRRHPSREPAGWDTPQARPLSLCGRSWGRASCRACIGSGRGSSAPAGRSAAQMRASARRRMCSERCDVQRRGELPQRAELDCWASVAAPRSLGSSRYCRYRYCSSISMDSRLLTMDSRLYNDGLLSHTICTLKLHTLHT